MDREDRASFPVEDVDPRGGEGEVDDREEEVDLGEHGSPGGEVIAPSVLAFEVVHGGSDVHGDFHLLEAVGEDEGVLIGVVLGEDGGEARVLVEFVEGEHVLDEI